MSRDHIRQLISAVQDRVRPPDHLPLPPAASPGLVPESFELRFDDAERTIAVPPDWQRPLPPDWIAGGIRSETDNPVEFEPDDEVTIETVDERGDLLPLPGGMGLQVSVHTNDHPPPHIHVQDLNQRRGTDERYRWPSLEPCSPDERLSSQLEKNLRDYVAQYHPAISERVQTIYGGALAL